MHKNLSMVTFFHKLFNPYSDTIWCPVEFKLKKNPSSAAELVGFEWAIFHPQKAEKRYPYISTLVILWSMGMVKNNENEIMLEYNLSAQLQNQASYD